MTTTLTGGILSSIVVRNRIYLDVIRPKMTLKKILDKTGKNKNDHVLILITKS